MTTKQVTTVKTLKDHYTTAEQYNVRFTATSALLSSAMSLSDSDIDTMISDIDTDITFGVGYGNSKIRDIKRYMLDTEITDNRDRYGRKVVMSHYFAVINFPSGYSCSNARDCVVYTNRLTGKQTMQSYTRYKCYSANLESAFGGVRRMAWANMDIIKDIRKLQTSSIDKVMRTLAILENSIDTDKTGIIRITAGGDIPTVETYVAIMLFARRHPTVRLFFYSKHIDYVRLCNGLDLDNIKSVYSIGGTDDMLVDDSDRIAYVMINSHDEPIQNVTLPNGTKRTIKLVCEFNTDGNDFYTILNTTNDIGLSLH